MSDPNEYGQRGLSAWDPSAGTMRSLSAEDLQREYTAGRINLLSQRTYPVVGSDGQVSDLPTDRIDEAIKGGGRFANPHDVITAEARSNLGMVGAFADGGINRAMLGFGDAAQVQMGQNAEAIEARRQAHPVARFAGEVTGLLAEGAITGGGGIGGALVRGVLGPASVTSAGAYVAANAAGMALEGAVQGAGDTVSEAALGQTDVTAEHLIAHSGLGAILGGATGAVFALPGAAALRGADKAALIQGATGHAPLPRSIGEAWSRLNEAYRGSAAQEAAGRTVTLVNQDVGSLGGVIARHLAKDAVGGAVGAMLGGPKGAVAGALMGEAMTDMVSSPAQLAAAKRAARLAGQWIATGMRGLAGVDAVRETAAAARDTAAGQASTDWMHEMGERLRFGEMRALPRVVAETTRAIETASSPSQRQEALAKRADELMDDASAAERASTATQTLANAAPNTATAVAAKAVEIAGRIRAALPRPLTNANPLAPRPDWRMVNDTDARRFGEVDAALQDPLRIVDQLKDGRIPDPAAVDAVRAAYPHLWTRMQSEFQTALTAAPTMPWRNTVAASAVFGVPIPLSHTPPPAPPAGGGRPKVRSMRPKGGPSKDPGASELDRLGA